jgi:hypothetical protein
MDIYVAWQTVILDCFEDSLEGSYLAMVREDLALAVRGLER